MQTRVLKIGGASLFAPKTEFSNLLAHLRREHRSDLYRTFIILGGGDTVESMRTLHASFPNLDHQAMHWRCVRLLDATWEVASELIDFAIPIQNQFELQQTLLKPSPNTYLVNVGAFYSNSLSPTPPAQTDSTPLFPKDSWNTTTDALAWWLAYLINADQVVLVKKKACDSIHSLAQAAHEGIVDAEIARLHDAARYPLASKKPLPSIQFLFENPDWKYHILKE
jgi:aspartokinase-like uncharacterized kinase